MAREDERQESEEDRRTSLFQRFEEQRAPIQIGADAIAWAVALLLAWLLRMEFRVDLIQWGELAIAIVAAAGLQVVAGFAEGLYTGRHRYGSFEEVAGLTRSLVLATAVGAAANAVIKGGLPKSVPIIAGFLALIMMAGTRYTWRIVLEHRKRPTEETAERALVFGAGEGASQLVTSMLRDPGSPYLPVGLIDDDPRKKNLRLRGVPVVGTRERLPAAVAETKATVLAIAVPSASGALIRDVAELARASDLKVLVLPPVSELLGGEVGVGQLRRITPADLLGRHEIDTDVDSIAGYLTGKRVLITGAGGSIGSELARQIYRFAPSELILLDRDESSLHAVQLSIHGRAMLDGDDLVVADLRDAERIREVFEEHRPQVVFHAAALKHLPLLERHPSEGVKTNVLGTHIVLQASLAAGVERFVNISTDKAADPISVLGYTKRIAERLTAWAAGRSTGTYLSVRFGNVLGSRGSMLTSFLKQIEDGGPVTVTHAEVTRYFMTVEEAVQLVIQAGAIGRDGEALVLDMGEPVRIADVAHRLIDDSGRRVRIEYTGLREGEKLHEVLLGPDERDVRPFHPLVRHVTVPAFEWDDRPLPSAPEQLRVELRALCHAPDSARDRS